MKAMIKYAFAATAVSCIVAACGPLVQMPSNERDASAPSEDPKGDAGAGIGYLDAIEACYRVPKSCAESVTCINYVLASMGRAPLQQAEWCARSGGDVDPPVDAGADASPPADAGGNPSWYPTGVTEQNYVAKLAVCFERAPACLPYLTCVNYVRGVINLPPLPVTSWRNNEACHI